jgi:hypothetical protein
MNIHEMFLWKMGRGMVDAPGERDKFQLKIDTWGWSLKYYKSENFKENDGSISDIFVHHS